nr:RNA-directed DNA polymerase, eukaryota, reverse transcriptase zinc-binding domain protein [Tanacetum cinerariifolium]
MARQQAWGGIVDLVKKKLSKWKMKMLSIRVRQENSYQTFRRTPRGGVEQEQFQHVDRISRSVKLNSNNDSWTWNLEKSDPYLLKSESTTTSPITPKRLESECIPSKPKEENLFKLEMIEVDKAIRSPKSPDWPPSCSQIHVLGDGAQMLGFPCLNGEQHAEKSKRYRCGSSSSGGSRDESLVRKKRLCPVITISKGGRGQDKMSGDSFRNDNRSRPAAHTPLMVVIIVIQTFMDLRINATPN